MTELIERVRLTGDLDPGEFSSIVFGNAESVTAMVGMPLPTANSDATNAAVQQFILAAVAILSKALIINLDESKVLLWFNNEHFAEFQSKTPAELVAQGEEQALTNYLLSIESGSSG